MGYAIKTLTAGGVEVNIYHDEQSESPRDWDNVATLVCFHPRYTLGDKHRFRDPQVFLEWAEEQEGITVQPLFLYDHSMLSISTRSFNGRAHHAGWDSGQVGYAYITKARAEEEKVNAKNCIDSEVETYDQFLRGDVYGFTLQDEYGEELDGSCWGFYGLNAVEEEARAAAKWEVERIAKDRSDIDALERTGFAL